MIDTAVVPSSCREFSDVIDVSSMNQKEIAKEIVSRANSKSAFNYILYFHSKHIKNELLKTVQMSFKHKVALFFHLVDTVPSEIEGHILTKIPIFVISYNSSNLMSKVYDQCYNKIFEYCFCMGTKSILSSINQYVPPLISIQWDDRFSLM